MSADGPGEPPTGEAAGHLSGAPPAALEAWRPPPFRPPAWALNPHVQTLAGKFLRPEPSLGFEREVWDTPDGDELVLDFAAPPADDEGTPTVLVLHGLEGNSRRRYALTLYGALVERGLRAVGLNFRGCARPNRAARAYHSGETGDLRFVLERLRERSPVPLAAVGFSLGGNVLLRFLGEAGAEGRAWLDAAVAVSVPYDLAAGALALEGSFMGRRYARYFLDSLLSKVRGRAELLGERIELDAALSSATLREFDDRVTAPLDGFRDADHYYAEASSGPWIGGIRVPTLLVHARDDPFLPWSRVPVDAAAANPWITTAFPERGGHVGFLEGAPWAPTPWAEAVAADFLATFLTRAAGPRGAPAPRPDANDPLG